MIRHINGRIQLKYGNFRPGNGDRIRCTVLRFSYGIIQYRIRCSFTVLCKRAVFDRRIRVVFVACHKSAIYGSRLRAVITPYLCRIIEMCKTHYQLPYNDIQSIALVETYLAVQSFINYIFIIRLTTTTMPTVSIILNI